MTYDRSRRGAGPTFTELMQRYIGGDDAAFPMIYRRLAPRVRGQIRSRPVADDEVDDLVQATFLRAHAARERYVTPAGDAEEAAAAWYCAIARNLVLSHLRKRGRDRLEVGPGAELTLRRTVTSDPNVEAGALEHERLVETQELVKQSLAQLPSTQREVVEMHKLRRLPMDEVARRLGITCGAVRVRAHRAYRRLAKLLAAAMAPPPRSAPGPAVAAGSGLWVAKERV